MSKRKRKSKNKKTLNKIINISVIIVLICAFIIVLNKNNITSYYKNKKLLKQAYATLEDKNNIYLYKQKYKENNIDTEYYILLNVVKKEINTIIIKNGIESTINTIELKKINKIANNDLIKLNLNTSSKNFLFSYYINMNIENNILYFSFLDGSMYQTNKNINLPDDLIKDILSSANYIKLIELKNKDNNLDILFSEMHKTIAILSKKNNKYVNISYLNPYISNNNNYTEYNVKSLLKHYKLNYDSTISLNIVDNKIYNTRNAYSKFITLISTEKEKIFNIRPAGCLYNVMFKPNFEFDINNTSIK